MEWERQVGFLLQSLLYLYLQKHDLLAEMFKITSYRSPLEGADNWEEILDLIDFRQTYIEKIDLVDKEIDKQSLTLAQLTMEKKMAGHLEQQRGKIEELKQLCLLLVGRMQDLDRRQKSLIEQQLANIKRKHEKLKTGRKTVDLYSSKPFLPESFFVDEKK